MPDDPTPAPNPAETFQRMLEKKNNDATALASQLFDENFRYRETIREMKEKQPADGSLVLSADDAKRWAAFNELGAEPKEIKKSLERLPELEKQNKELAGMESLRELADIGLDGSKLKLSVLKDQLARYPDAVIRFDKQKDKDGNESKVAFIKDKPDGTELSFNDFAAQNLSDYLPALKVTAEQSMPPAPGASHDPPPTGGTGSVFDRIRESVTKKTEAVKPRDIDQAFGKAA